MIENQQYSWQEICNELGWNKEKLGHRDRVIFAKNQGYELILASEMNANPIKYFIKQREYLTWQELGIKFGWKSKEGNPERRIQVAKRAGIEIEIDEEHSTPHKKYYRIKNTSGLEDYEWKVFPYNSYYEVCKEGFVRTTNGKGKVGHKNANGYIQVSIAGNKINPEDKGFYLVHRMIMETFNPIENSQDYIVDHINGKRDDNRLENLRWATQEENMLFKQEKYSPLLKLVKELVLVNGYEETYKLLDDLVKRRPAK